MEIEVKLSYRPGAPISGETLLAQLSTMAEVGGYRLGDAREKAIRDTYFDTADQRLHASRMTLRLREKNGIITLKSKMQRQGALAQRDEFESPLSPDAIAVVEAHLRAAGILSPGDTIAPESFTAGSATGGLLPHLVLVNRRIDREIRRAKDGVAVGTLSLDRVTYEGAPWAPVFYDVEVEASSAAFVDDLAAIQDSLLALFGSALTVMQESKAGRGLRLVAAK